MWVSCFLFHPLLCTSFWSICRRKYQLCCNQTPLPCIAPRVWLRLAILPADTTCTRLDRLLRALKNEEFACSRTPRAQEQDMFFITWLLVVATTAAISSAHTVITYPGWRGNNLHTNGTRPEDNPGSLGIDFTDNGTAAFPWGMQWMYPCKQTVSPRIGCEGCSQEG